MRGPLSLVIDDGNGPQHVTRRTTGLRFKRSAYGGDIDLTATVSTDRSAFTDLGPGDSVAVYDGRTGGPVFRATANLPGQTVGPFGESYDLQALGGAVRLQAVTDSLAYVHTLDGDWKRVGSTKGARTETDEKNDGTPTIEFGWDKRFELETNDQAQMGNRAFARAGLKLGRVKASWDAGRTSANQTVEIRTGSSIDDLGAADSDTVSTAGGTLAAWISGGGITLGHNTTGLRLRHTGANLNVKADTGTGNGPIEGNADGDGNVTGTADVDTGTGDTTGGVPDKTFWARFWDVTVFQVLKDKFGADITTASRYSGADANIVYAHEVIKDMLGRGMCPGLDMDKVTVGTFTYAIDALAWLDGIKMGDALNELLLFEPDLTWQVYGDTANFDAWPIEPRYVISARDGGVSHPGEEISLADRIFVEWTDSRGRQQRTKVTDSSVDVKQEADPISLPEGVGSAANAQRAGEKALGMHNDPPRAGTAVVRRPIADRWTGALVQPWEIHPGCLVQEMETGHEFRLTETEYIDDDVACVLTLGEPRRTLEQVIARLERKQRRKKGK